MARRPSDNLTLDMFSVPTPAAPLPASMDYGREVALLVGQIIKETDGDRYEIAARMSRLTGRDVSKYMIDAWASESRDAYNIPFYMAPVFESACSTHLLSTWLADKRGGRLLIGREALNAELGKMEHLREDLNKKIRVLKKSMGELE